MVVDPLHDGVVELVGLEDGDRAFYDEAKLSRFFPKSVASIGRKILVVVRPEILKAPGKAFGGSEDSFRYVRRSLRRPIRDRYGSPDCDRRSC